MSTAPSGWQTPKTNWDPTHGVGASDFNRIEGNINAIETGERTLDPSLPGAANSGSLRQILSWLAGRIRAITGKTNWYEAPAITLEQAQAHVDAEAPHSGHAKTGSANTFTAKNTFQADVQLGGTNVHLIDVFGLIVPLSTHTKEVATWDTTYPEKPKTVQIKDGSTVLATIEVTARNGEGKPTQLKITQGIHTRTWTISWTSGKEFPDSVVVS